MALSLTGLKVSDVVAMQGEWPAESQMKSALNERQTGGSRFQHVKVISW